ncbi:FkbM family methyltransferase [Priestia megaterium]|uniref:FkbM family methyltransferase n=3 Tax=Priestia megaterium TaxID=1404 RepID=UPI003009874B
MSSNIKTILKNDVNYSVISKPATEWIWNAIHQNKWEEQTFKIFDRFLNPENSYIDLGAWIGPTVLYGAHKAKHVYGVEPDPVAFNELITNIQLNPLIAKKVTCINAALAEESGTINLYMRSEFGDSTSSLIPTIAENSCKVKAITIHDLINENHIENINFIKMDIEGGEYFLIPTVHDFLQSQKPTLYLSIHPGFLKEHVMLISSNQGETSNYFNIQTKKLLDCLQFYKYIYDIFGNQVKKDAILDVTRTGEFLFTNECW